MIVQDKNGVIYLKEEDYYLTLNDEGFLERTFSIEEEKKFEGDKTKFKFFYIKYDSRLLFLRLDNRLLLDLFLTSSSSLFSDSIVPISNEKVIEKLESFDLRYADESFKHFLGDWEDYYARKRNVKVNFCKYVANIHGNEVSNIEELKHLLERKFDTDTGTTDYFKDLYEDYYSLAFNKKTEEFTLTYSYLGAEMKLIGCLITMYNSKRILIKDVIC